MSSPPGSSAFWCVTSSFMDDRHPVARSVFVAVSGSVAVLSESGIAGKDLGSALYEQCSCPPAHTAGKNVSAAEPAQLRGNHASLVRRRSQGLDPGHGSRLRIDLDYRECRAMANMRMSDAVLGWNCCFHDCSCFKTAGFSTRQPAGLLPEYNFRRASARCPTEPSYAPAPPPNSCTYTTVPATALSRTPGRRGQHRERAGRDHKRCSPPGRLYRFSRIRTAFLLTLSNSKLILIQ